MSDISIGGYKGSLGEMARASVHYSAVVTPPPPPLLGTKPPLEAHSSLMSFPASTWPVASGYVTGVRIAAQALLELKRV